jgi:uncharacterized protein (DUF433 family)
MRTMLILGLALLSPAALAADVLSISPYAHINDSPAEIARAYPDLTPEELVMLTFRIADARSVQQLKVMSAPITTAASVNPFSYLGATREELAAAFPHMPAAELDRLVFRIADAQSLTPPAEDETRVAERD